MSYSYEVEKKQLFTEDGSVAFIKGRDAALRMLRESGAFRCQEWMGKSELSGDSWMMLAILDRMVELGELVKLRPDESCWQQFQVYTSPQVHNH